MVFIAPRLKSARISVRGLALVKFHIITINLIGGFSFIGWQNKDAQKDSNTALRVNSVQLVVNIWINCKRTIYVPIFRFNEKLSRLNWFECNNSFSSTSTAVVLNLTGRACVAAMFIGSGAKFLSLRTERIFRRRFSTIDKLIIIASDVPTSCSIKISQFLGSPLQLHF